VVSDARRKAGGAKYAMNSSQNDGLSRTLELLSFPFASLMRDTRLTSVIL
jgi:hypothetical protein